MCDIVDARQHGDRLERAEETSKRTYARVRPAQIVREQSASIAAERELLQPLEAESAEARPCFRPAPRDPIDLT